MRYNTGKSQPPGKQATGEGEQEMKENGVIQEYTGSLSRQDPGGISHQ